MPGDEIEVLAHPHVAVVRRVVGPTRPPAQQGRDDDPGEVVGVDVVRVRIGFVRERRGPGLQALDGQTVGGVDARHAEDRHRDARRPPPVAEAHLGVGAAHGAGRFRMQRTRLGNPFAPAVAVDAARAEVDKTLW